jgi:hypothetical protein
MKTAAIVIVQNAWIMTAKAVRWMDAQTWSAQKMAVLNRMMMSAANLSTPLNGIACTCA